MLVAVGGLLSFLVSFPASVARIVIMLATDSTGTRSLNRERYIVLWDLGHGSAPGEEKMKGGNGGRGHLYAPRFAASPAYKITRYFSTSGLPGTRVMGVRPG